MIIDLTILLAVIATVFSITALVVPSYLRSLLSAAISLVLWLGLAAGSPEIGIPYIFENSADNGITSGVYQISGVESWAAVIFLFMAVLMGLYIWFIVSEQTIKDADKIATPHP